jgi:hypothetical protein
VAPSTVEPTVGCSDFLNHFASSDFELLNIPGLVKNIIEWFLSYFTFYTPKKVVLPLKKVENILLKKVALGIEKSVILRWFQKGAELLS